jgi:hypothetical protein
MASSLVGVSTRAKSLEPTDAWVTFGMTDLEATHMSSPSDGAEASESKSSDISFEKNIRLLHQKFYSGYWYFIYLGWTHFIRT